MHDAVYPVVTALRAVLHLATELPVFGKQQLVSKFVAPVQPLLRSDVISKQVGRRLALFAGLPLIFLYCRAWIALRL